MEKSLVEQFLNKNITLKTDSSRVYSGKIIEMYEDSILFRDKFGNDFALAFNELRAIQIAEVFRR